MAPPVQNRGGGRGGFGAGRQSRGAGRFRGRGYVWQRAGGGDGDGVGDGSGYGSQDPPRQNVAERLGQRSSENELDTNTEIQGENTSPWDRAAKANLESIPELSRDAERKHESWGNTSREGKAPIEESNPACNLCGLKNHSSDECMRKNPCENCGYHNHTTAECRRESLWNYGPKLCAAQVDDQSFFFIEEIIDPRATMEKASTTVITVMSGEATTKQIKSEFKKAITNRTWRWSARKLAENKYALRFPEASMVHVYNNFTCLGMKEAVAQIKVEPWSPSAGAKGELQQAWFHVKGIPTDQRSLKTIAKVGGLVGKTVAIDEKTRHMTEYVRVKIACRDISQVPASAESALGMKLYDFFFEREMNEEVRPESSKIGVTNDTQPTPKKPRTDGAANDKSKTGTQDGGSCTPGKGCAFKVNNYSYLSAPAKCMWGGDQKHKGDFETKERNEESWEETDESDNYSLGINGGPERDLQEGESSKGDYDIGLVQCPIAQHEELHRTLLAKKAGKSTQLENSVEKILGGLEKMTFSAEAARRALMADKDGVMENEADAIPEQKHGLTQIVAREERRVSERLKGDLMLTTDDKSRMVGKKRNLEGLFKPDLQVQLAEGVKVLLAAACNILASRPSPAPATLRILLADEEDSEE